MILEEEQLIHEILGGKTQLYAEIVKTYQANVANLTYKLCGNKLDVEEVTQQVFVELYSALPRFQFKSKLSTFIYRITVNVVSKLLAHEKRISPLPENDNPLEDQHSISAEQQIVKQEQIDQLRKCIGLLHQEQRTALVLYTFNDFSYKDIADVMQVSLSKVESLIFRAKKNLKKMLEEKK